MQLIKTEFTQNMFGYAYVMTRICSLFISAPLFSNKNIPLRVKTALSLLLAFIITPTINLSPIPDPISLSGLLLLLQQVLIGLIIGFIFQLILHISVIGGQMIAIQSGLAHASIVDPINQRDQPILSDFFVMITLLLFLISNGHILAISMIHNSFDLIPISLTDSYSFSYLDIVIYFGDIFSAALGFAIPTITAMFIINLTLAIMARSSPQLNIFNLGLPLMLFAGLFLIYLNLPNIVDHIETILVHEYQNAMTLVRSSNG